MQTFRFTYATTIGHSHRKLFYNSQDAICVRKSPERLIAVLADGCGSKPNSEVGAQLATRFLVDAITQMLEQEEDWKSQLQSRHTAWAMDLVRNQQARDQESFIRDHLFYIVIGLVIEGKSATIFSAGDGVTLVNDTLTVIDQQNAPRYLNLGLLEEANPVFSFNEFSLNGVKTLAIGSDGVEDLVDALTKGHLPGIPDFPHLVADASMYNHPLALDRLLNQLMLSGQLKDDTTLAIVHFPGNE